MDDRVTHWLDHRLAHWLDHRLAIFAVAWRSSGAATAATPCSSVQGGEVDTTNATPPPLSCPPLPGGNANGRNRSKHRDHGIVELAGGNDLDLGAAPEELLQWRGKSVRRRR